MNETNLNMTQHRPRVFHIVAVQEDFGIGKDNQLLHRDPVDMKRFRMVTQGNVVLMGRKTFESIGRPLPNRINVVLSRNVDLDLGPDVHVFQDLNAAREFCTDQCLERKCDMAVIGGAEIYKLTLPFTDFVHLTVFEQVNKDADAYYLDKETFLSNFYKDDSRCLRSGGLRFETWVRYDV